MQCLSGGTNGKAKYGRRDVIKMFHNYSGLPESFLFRIAKDKEYRLFNGIIETIVDGMQAEIIDREYRWRPIWKTHRRENNKVREIGVQDIKQQLYDYIAVNGLMELFHKKIGYYQCAAIPHKGQLFGKNAIKKWISNRNMRYAWKGDAKHYYENVDSGILKKLLSRYVKNEPLLHLTFSLIDSFGKGLSIGSYLSQYLANFYMSFAYQFASQALVKKRRGKTRRLISRVLIYMDDILFIGKCQRDLKMAVRQFKKWVWDKLAIQIKETEEWIDLADGYIDMMGFCISRKKVIVRSRIFIRYRRIIHNIKRCKLITLKQAYRAISLDGWAKNSDCKYWRKKNKADQVIKLCKEMISSGKDVIRFATTKGNYCAVA